VYGQGCQVPVLEGAFLVYVSILGTTVEYLAAFVFWKRCMATDSFCLNCVTTL